MRGLRQISRFIPSGPRRPRPRVAVALAAALLGGVALPATVAPAHALEAPVITEARLLKQLYLIGVSRVARGNPAGAVQPFQVVSEVAPELPEGHYSLAMAMVLADFAHRARALPIVDKALALSPSHPLYAAVRVLADPASSTLRDDGALWLTAAGAERMRGAVAGMGRVADARNARYLAPVLGAMQPTGDAAYPERLAGFDRMIGQGGKIAVAKLGEGVAFGQLFTLNLADNRFDGHRGEAVALLPGGVQSLTEAQPSYLGEVETMEVLVDHRAHARSGETPRFVRLGRTNEKLALAR
jgi:hypothetical protein